MERRLYRADDLTEVLGLGLTTVKELIRSGRIKSVREGRARLVPAESIDDYVNQLKQEAERPDLRQAS